MNTPEVGTESDFQLSETRDFSACAGAVMTKGGSAPPDVIGSGAMGIRFHGRKEFAVNTPRPQVAPRYKEMSVTRAVRFKPEVTREDHRSIRLIRRIIIQAGLNPADYRLAPLLRRLPACLRVLKTDSLATAAEFIRNDSVLFRKAVNTLLNGTTSFFRDSLTFDALEQSVIPAILRRRRKPRIWSVACSEGAELYSVAMLIDHHAPGGLGACHGTDCRSAALEIARKGAYGAQIEEEIRPDLAAKYLIRKGPLVTVADHLIRQMTWERRDALCAADSTAKWDMILCRNLAIYLESSTALRLWQSLTNALMPDGILVVGKAERPQVPGLRRIGPCIFKKTSAFSLES